jgi:hypothetical protein
MPPMSSKLALLVRGFDIYQCHSHHHWPPEPEICKRVGVQESILLNRFLEIDSWAP